MKASLREKNGYFYIVVSDKTEDGKYTQKWEKTGLTVTGNKRRAEAVLSEYMQSYKSNAETAVEQAEVAQTVIMPDLIIEWLRVKKASVRANTYTSYKDTADMHVIPYFEQLGVTVNELAPKHIQAYYTEKHEQGLQSATLTRHRTIIRDSLDYAIQTLGVINANPADRVKLPKVTCKRIPAFYTEEQLNKLFKTVEGESIEAPVRISATYGLRRSEVLGLRWSAVDFKRKTVAILHTAVRDGTKVVYDNTVKKNASYRTMPLTSTMKSYLLRLQARQKQMKKLCKSGYNDNDYICKWDDGKPLDPDYVTSRFGRFLKEKKLPHIRFHDLRHSSASLLINKGFTLKEVQEWLGHADIASTDIYSHLLYKSKENMAEKVNEALAF